eukprot:gene5220-10449_t
MERQTNFKVVVRVRPPLPRELSGMVSFQNIVAVDGEERQITISDNIDAVLDYRGQMTDMPTPYNSHLFCFDHVYDQYATQKKIFETTARPVVESSLQGYNATISDLLKTDRVNLLIREDKKRGVFVEGLSEWVVRSPAEIYGLMERGAQLRATGETKMNEVSSRSHAVFIIIVEQSKSIYVDDNGAEISPEELSDLLLSQHGLSERRDDRTQQQLQRLLEDHIRQSFKGIIFIK